ncbi:hypothetical protein SETIT_2G222200v2, partial [Setaria italica]
IRAQVKIRIIGACHVGLCSTPFARSFFPPLCSVLPLLLLASLARFLAFIVTRTSPTQNPSRRRRCLLRTCLHCSRTQKLCDTRGTNLLQHVLLSPPSRHGGEAIDRRGSPPPPPDAAAEKDEGSQGLQLPEDIRWERLDKARFFVLGAGLFSAVSAALYPAVVLKTRLQWRQRVRQRSLPPPSPRPPPLCAGRGPLAFYRGFATSLAGTVPARALYMGALEATRSAVGPVALNLGAPEPAASAAAGAAAGLAAAVAAQVVWTPVDVISQRLMVQGNPCPASRYRGGVDAFRKIVGSDGLRGLYRGFGMSILTYAPSNAVCQVARPLW